MQAPRRGSALAVLRKTPYLRHMAGLVFCCAIAAAALELIADDSRSGESLVVNNPSAKGEAHAVERLVDRPAFLDYALTRASLPRRS